MARQFYFCLCLLAALSHAQFMHNQLPLGSSFGVAGQNATYDYVIVGGGTAGLPLATRLAQDGRYSVAVLEAGGLAYIDNSNRSLIPGDAYYSAGNTLDGVNPKIDWRFLTTPQPAKNGDTWHYTRGKTLGGSSARNLMAYQRPAKGAMDKWAKDVGDASWGWENVLPYYRRSATLTRPNTKLRPANATALYDLSAFNNGPIQVSYPDYVDPFSSWAINGWAEMGDPVRSNGFESGSLIGHQYLPQTVDAKLKQRSFAGNTYLDIALRETQLTVYTGALVKKILFTEKKATGLSVETDGVPYTITANREVILSAGAFQSPQLLMVSGIGPADTLRKHGITVIADRPGVGQNLQDNPLFWITFAVDLETSSVYLRDEARYAQAFSNYNHNRTGFLATSSVDAISFQKLNNTPGFNLSTQARADLSKYPSDWPDFEFVSMGTYNALSLGSPAPDTRNYASYLAGLLTPESRGTVTISSADTADAPIIDPKWLTHPTDKELAIAGVRRMRQFLQTNTIGKIFIEEAYPGANVTSDEDILAHIRAQLQSLYHAAGTCKMGLANVTMAVVDSKARVMGVSGLRVVDLSAVPFLPIGQPQATVYMMAEKMADEILHGDDGQGY